MIYPVRYCPPCLMCHYRTEILGCDVHLFGVECYSALLSVVQIKQRPELPYVILVSKSFCKGKLRGPMGLSGEQMALYWSRCPSTNSSTFPGLHTKSVLVWMWHSLELQRMVAFPFVQRKTMENIVRKGFLNGFWLAHASAEFMLWETTRLSP